MKLEVRVQVFRIFQSGIVYRKANYKFELVKKWKIYNVFHILLLEQDIIKKKRADKKLEIELKVVNNIKYKVEVI